MPESPREVVGGVVVIDLHYVVVCPTCSLLGRYRIGDDVVYIDVKCPECNEPMMPLHAWQDDILRRSLEGG